MISGLRAPLRLGFDGRQRVGGRVQRRVAAPVGCLQGAALQHAAEVALQVQRIEKEHKMQGYSNKIEGCAMRQNISGPGSVFASKRSVVT